MKQNETNRKGKERKMEAIDNLSLKVEISVSHKEGYSTDRKYVELKSEKTTKMTLEKAKAELERIAMPLLQESLDELNLAIEQPAETE